LEGGVRAKRRGEKKERKKERKRIKSFCGRGMG